MKLLKYFGTNNHNIKQCGQKVKFFRTFSRLKFFFLKNEFLAVVLSLQLFSLRVCGFSKNTCICISDYTHVWPMAMRLSLLKEMHFTSQKLSIMLCRLVGTLFRVL